MFHSKRRFRDSHRHVSYRLTFQRQPPSCFISTDVSETATVHIIRLLTSKISGFSGGVLSGNGVSDGRYLAMLSTVRFSAWLRYHAIFTAHTDVPLFGVDPTRLLLSAMDISVTATFYVDRFPRSHAITNLLSEGYVRGPSTYLLHLTCG